MGQVNEAGWSLETGDGLMNVEDVIAYLRLPSRQSLYALTHEKRIPHSKPAGRLLFRKRDIDRWIEAHRVEVSQAMDAIREKIA